MARAKKTVEATAPSRWFRVTGERFDWSPKPNVMITFPHGSIGYRPMACINVGVSTGVIEVIEHPKGYSVDKSGNVVRNGD